MEENISKKKVSENDLRQVGKDYIDHIQASLLQSSENLKSCANATVIEDPYMKAYRYLQNNQILSLLEVYFKLLLFSVHLFVTCLTFVFVR